MARLFSNRDRPFDLGVLPTELLVRPKGVNERDLSPGREGKLAGGQKLAFFPPALQPAGGTTLQQVVPIDRPAGLAAYAAAESPEDARKRSRPRE